MILLALASLLASATAAPAQPQCDLTVIAEGVHSDEGSIGFILFASKEGWPDDYGLSFQRQGIPARTGDVEVVFSAVPPGEYAVVVTHDENGNKQLDRSPSGRPLEGWGMSNNPKGRLRTPAFSKAAVQVGCSDRIEIRMQYRKKEGGKGSAQWWPFRSDPVGRTYTHATVDSYEWTLYTSGTFEPQDRQAAEGSRLVAMAPTGRGQ